MTDVFNHPMAVQGFPVCSDAHQQDSRKQHKNPDRHEHHPSSQHRSHSCTRVSGVVPADVMKRLLIFQLLSDAVRVRGYRAPAVNQVPEEVTRLI